ncbi:MAG: DUF1043 family protein [Glaciecola sp.]
MDVTTLVIGVILGLVFGAVVTWLLMRASMQAKSQRNNATEAEIKGLLAQQALGHIESSRQGIQGIETQLNALKQSLNQYEGALQAPSDDAEMPFFGEHASVFLRNTSNTSSSNNLETSTGDQPKDFANNGSGLFAGNPALLAEEKSNN